MRGGIIGRLGGCVRLAGSRLLSILFSILGGAGLAVLVLVAPALAQRQGPPVLVRIDLKVPGDLPSVAALGLPVHAHLTAPGVDYLLAVLTSRSQNRLQSLDLTWTVLDPHASDAVYYLIESGHPRMAERVAPVFTILHDDGRQALGRLREGVPLSAVDSLGLPVVRLWLDPILLTPRITGAIPTTSFYDPLVADLLAQITVDIVYGYDGGLSGEWPILVGGQSYLLTTRYSYSSEPIAKATQYVYEYMQARGYDVDYHHYSLEGYELRNVVGEKRGLVHPDQVFLLTAHLDSRAENWPHNPAPGADDNASGSTALLVTADLLADLDLAYTVRVVFFTGEEQGMWGSYYYVRDAASVGEDILGVLNLDMIAWDAKDGPDIDLHANLPAVEDDSDGLANLFAAVVDVYGLDLEAQIVEDGTVFSDHSRFWDQGYAAILAIEDYYNADESPAEFRDWNPNYHTVNDRLSILNLAYFREYVRASLATLVHLARPMRTLSGTITDGSTAAPLNATVVAAGQEGVFDDTTHDSGSYEIVLPSGFYTVTASADGYYSQTLANVAVLTGTVKALDFALKPLASPPLYDFNLSGQTFHLAEPMERVTYTVTIVNTGVLSDAYDLVLGPSVGTATLPFTRTALLPPQQQLTVSLRVTIPPDATAGYQDRVALTVTSVYSPVHVSHIVLRAAVGHKICLPLVLGQFQSVGPPEPCYEAVVNGGFELDEGWEIPVTPYSASYTTATAHSGSHSMRVGIVEPSDNVHSYSSARQTVTIPPDTISATLRFWLHPLSGEATTLNLAEGPTGLDLSLLPAVPSVEAASLAGDGQYVLILDEQDQEIGRLVVQRRDDRQWIPYQFDLMSYAGQTIKLYFGVYNDGSDGVTAMYVDDVSLEICGGTGVRVVWSEMGSTETAHAIVFDTMSECGKIQSLNFEQ